MSKTIGRGMMISLVVLLLAAIPLVGACAEEAEIGEVEAPAEVIKWKLQSYVPATVDSYIIMGPDLAALINEMSNGRLVIECYASGELVQGKEILGAVSRGVVDVGVGIGSYWAGEIPVATLEYGLPYSFTSKTEAQSFLLNQGFIEILREAYAEHNVYYLGLAIDNGFTLLSKDPVNTVADLTKMKLRATGGGGDLLKELGASMVSVSGSELYTALATAVIDGCVYGGFKTQWNLGNHEQTNYIMWPKIMSVHGPWNLLINMDSWNALDDDLKAIVETAWIQQEALNFINKYNGDIEYLAKMQAYGLKVVTLPEAEQAKMVEAAKVVWASIAAEDEYCARAVGLLEDYLKFLGR